jgi:hypothetical protein
MINILPKIKKFGFKLDVFSNDSVMLEIKADNPDDACYLAYKEFCDYILGQSSTAATKNLLKDLKDDFLVVRLVPSEKL